MKNYFQNIFTTSSPSHDIIVQANQSIVNCISPETAANLDSSFSFEDVKKALFDMKPWKAPGPDGFHAGFFQN